MYGGVEARVESCVFIVDLAHAYSISDASNNCATGHFPLKTRIGGVSNNAKKRKMKKKEKMERKRKTNLFLL